MTTYILRRLKIIVLPLEYVKDRLDGLLFCRRKSNFFRHLQDKCQRTDYVLQSFRTTLKEKLNSLLALDTKIQCLKCVSNIGESRFTNKVSAAEEVIPDLQYLLRQFSFGNRGVSLKKTLNDC